MPSCLEYTSPIYTFIRFAQPQVHEFFCILPQQCHTQKMIVQPHAESLRAEKIRHPRSGQRTQNGIRPPDGLLQHGR